MTYCESCDKEIKNDEWREHIRSGKHLIRPNTDGFKYCEVCKMRYSTSKLDYYGPPEKGYKHLESNFHERNLIRSRYIFK